MMRQFLNRLKTALGLTAQAPKPAEAAAPAQRIYQRITIEGAGRVELEAFTLKSFGFNPRQVLDVVVVPPAGVQGEAAEALSAVYAEGGTRGTEAAALATGARALHPHERLYFALVGSAPATRRVLHAFVMPERVLPVRTVPQAV